MRRIHIRFKENKSLDRKVLKDGDEYNFLVRNSKGQQIILRHPQVKRTLVGGVYILDHWGETEKWFSDTMSSLHNPW